LWERHLVVVGLVYQIARIAVAALLALLLLLLLVLLLAQLLLLLLVVLVQSVCHTLQQCAEETLCRTDCWSEQHCCCQCEFKYCLFHNYYCLVSINVMYYFAKIDKKTVRSKCFSGKALIFVFIFCV